MLPADGGIAWHTPGGHVVVTHPPRLGADDDLPSPADPDPPPAATDDDPPPF